MSTNAHVHGEGSTGDDASSHERNISSASRGAKLKFSRKKKKFMSLSEFEDQEAAAAAAIQCASEIRDSANSEVIDPNPSWHLTPTVPPITTHAQGLSNSPPPRNDKKLGDQLMSKKLRKTHRKAKEAAASSTTVTATVPAKETTVTLDSTTDDFTPTPTEKRFLAEAAETAMENLNPNKLTMGGTTVIAAKTLNQHAPDRVGIQHFLNQNQNTSTPSIEYSTAHSLMCDESRKVSDESFGLTQEFKQHLQRKTLNSFKYGIRTLRDADEESIDLPAATLPGRRHGAADDFDTVEWDGQGTSDLDNSPQQLPVQVKKVENLYTTAGTLVNPNSNTAPLSAPQRIQREGAGRRHAMTTPQANQQNAAYYAARPYAHNQYPQHYNPNPVNANFQHGQGLNTGCAGYGQAAPTTHPMAEYGMGAMGQFFNGQTPTSPYPVNGSGYATSTSGEKSIYENSLSTKLDSYVTNNTHAGYEYRSEFPGRVAMPKPVKSQDAESSAITQRPTIPVTITSEGLQVLSRYDNPIKDAIKDAAGNHVATLVCSTSPKPDTIAVLDLLPGKEQLTGELNRSYQFPPLGLDSPSMAQSNPLYGVISPLTAPCAPSNPPARGPQPLTAGPPGQRSHRTTNRLAANSLETQWPNQTPVLSKGAQLWQSLGYPLNQGFIDKNLYDQNQPPTHPRTPVFDTAPPEVAQKYYPNGFKPRTYKQMSALTAKETELGRQPTTADMKPFNIAKIISDNNSGARRFHMSLQQIDAEYQLRQHPDFKPDPCENFNFPPQITVAEMNAMPLHEAAEPIFKAAYATLLRYQDRGPNSDRIKSGYETSANNLVDRSKDGNKTFFGEDWGRPKTNRFGRNPRYNNNSGVTSSSGRGTHRL
ncbi:hypothetical protein BJ878DRAFT_545360 [Calycina marina]|uniref:Uncharacterized protein n=1 Tax=Calycina marina TaxID=1763456 RepID=A0A9P8CBW8_9HELO|nr:hypothetical protein BJ878DRAFT_545360 [Calycina marina]